MEATILPFTSVFARSGYIDSTQIHASIQIAEKSTHIWSLKVQFTYCTQVCNDKNYSTK